MNPALLFPDYFQPTVSYAPTIYGPSWQSAYPLANLQQLLLSLPARSIDCLAANTKFDVDLGVNRLIGMLAIGRHNVTSAGGMVVKMSTAADFSVNTHTSASLAMSPAGKIAEDLDGYNVNWHYVLTPVSARYVRFEITDTANPAGYIELARLLIGGLLQPASMGNEGVALGWVDDSTVKSTIGGVDRVDDRRPRRSQRLYPKDMTDAEAFDQLFEMQRRNRKKGQTFFSYDASLTSFRRWQKSFLCTFRELSAIENPYANGHSAGIDLKEVL